MTDVPVVYAAGEVAPAAAAADRPGQSARDLGGSRLRKDASRRTGDDRRDEILGIAMELFAAEGYRATRLTDIADEMGFTRAAVYYYFTAKEDILVELCDSAAMMLRTNLERALASDESPVAVVAKIIHNHVVINLRNRKLFSVFVAERSELPWREQRRLAAEERWYIDSFDEIIRRAVETGGFRDVPSKPTGLILLGTATSAMRWFRDERELSVTDVADLIVDLAMAGLVPRNSSNERSQGAHDSASISK